MTEEELWSLTRDKLAAAEEGSAEPRTFLVCVESGLVYRELLGKSVYLVKTVAVVRGLGGEAVGSSGELQLPELLVSDLSPANPAFRCPAPGAREAWSIP